MISNILKKVLSLSLLAFVLPFNMSPANAHASLQVYGQNVVEGASSTVFVRIGHGCSGKSVDKVSVSIPNGFTSVKPFQIPGFENTVVKNSDGVVTELTWSGGLLKDGAIMEFPFSAKMPSAGRYYIPVVQYCGEDKESWIELPVEGSTATLAYPAPSLLVNKVAVAEQEVDPKMPEMSHPNIGEFFLDSKEITAKLPLSYKNKSLKVTTHMGELIGVIKLNKFAEGSLSLNRKTLARVKSAQSSDMDHLMVSIGSKLINHVELNGIKL